MHPSMPNYVLLGTCVIGFALQTYALTRRTTATLYAGWRAKLWSRDSFETEGAFRAFVASQFAWSILVVILLAQVFGLLP
jgi:hypothetical protein